MDSSPVSLEADVIDGMRPDSPGWRMPGVAPEPRAMTWTEFASPTAAGRGSRGRRSPGRSAVSRAPLSAVNVRERGGMATSPALRYSTQIVCLIGTPGRLRRGRRGSWRGSAGRRRSHSKAFGSRTTLSSPLRMRTSYDPPGQPGQVEVERERRSGDELTSTWACGRCRPARRTRRSSDASNPAPVTVTTVGVGRACERCPAVPRSG